jgi:hypothetical protein
LSRNSIVISRIASCRATAIVETSPISPPYSKILVDTFASWPATCGIRSR